MPESRVHYGGDESLERRVDSLESGSGGSVDLSAVDQDIIVLNSHVADFQGDVGSDSSAHTTLGWRDDNYGLCAVGVPGSGVTDSYVQDPDQWQNYVNVSAGTHVSDDTPFAKVNFRIIDGAGPFAFNASIAMAGANTLETGDMRHTAGSGPILQAPDASLHRLIVANDGTLSTEPVV